MLPLPVPASGLLLIRNKTFTKVFERMWKNERITTVRTMKELIAASRMKIRHSVVLAWALAGFSLGTVLAVSYVATGASFLHLRQDWAQVAFYPGFFVGYHTFDVLGYSAAVSLACLAVGFVYSAIASAVAGLVKQLVFLLKWGVR